MKYEIIDNKCLAMLRSSTRLLKTKLISKRVSILMSAIIRLENAIEKGSRRPQQQKLTHPMKALAAFIKGQKGQKR